MHKPITYLFIVLFFLFGIRAQAQDTDYDSAYAPVDSVGSVENIIEDSYDSHQEEEKAARFDALTTSDKQLVTPRNVDNKVVNKMRKDDDFWYVNEVPVKEKPIEPRESFLNKLAKQKWFRNLLWVLVVGGFIAVLVWFIVSSDIQLFKRSSAAIAKQEEDDLINQSIFDIQYDLEIQKAVSHQNFRLAIRLLYLQTLKRLAEENIIAYKQERTNSDYLLQLFNTGYYKDFFRLTRHFEYAWYGQFPVAPASFDVIRSDFSNFKQRYLK